MELTTTPEANMHSTTLNIGGREVTVRGDHLYDVSAATDDGQIEGPTRIAASRPSQAQTHFMAQSSLTLNGQTVEFTTVEVA